ncbi:GC-rich sequence DNA-binding factor 2 [Grifola frondosa]|uniref:GC-rich sequence DNA-binding factor 2 n=1 Tax=Grifola frondosa TaxID=5627 RepID=A0A1C7M0L8_GRIFR|nr:GC-rich sequence DNA-binding factor 2 [Grifola frondosa]
MSVDPESLGQSSSLSSVIDLSMEMESETIIPSESSVMVAKQKRERLRASGASGEDYISLSVSKRSDFSQGPHPESRLMREDDELGDADDGMYTVLLYRPTNVKKKSRKAEARKLREEMNEMIVDAEEQDEETMEWEEEQLRRGGMRVEELAKEALKLTYKPAPIPAVTPIPTLGASIARLTQSLTSLTTSHAEHSASMAKLGEEQRQLESREKDMREMIAKAEEKRSWFSAFREWVESVATFLDEKYSQLEKLEDEHVSLLKERADMISQRRLTEDEDDLSLFFGSLPESQSTPTEELDDLGRIVQRANPAAVRRDRLTARRARRSRRAADRAQTEEEGYSTDSSLPPLDAADYKLATGNLALKAREIMSDVKAEEFKNPDVGLSKWFGEWRARFGDSYTGAWGGLGMVGAWEFWVRLEILGWSPLEQTRSLDSFSWYGALYVYSRPGELQDDEEPEMGPDGDLLSAMISTAVIPRICKVLESGGFDPYSAKEVKNLVDLAEQIEVSVGKDTAKFEALLKSAFTVFQAAVRVTDGLIPRYLSLNKPRFDPEAIPARRRFLMRRYKLLRNIIQWRKYSGEKFGIGSLVTELVSGCMLPVAESGWEVGGGDCMRKVL